MFRPSHVLIAGLALGFAVAAAAAADFTAERVLWRETESALASLRPEIEAAPARWRAEFVGKLTTRNGQPLAEAEVLIETRRAMQAVDEAGPFAAKLWSDLEENRLDRRGFGDALDTLIEQAVVTSWDLHLAEARHSLAVTQAMLDTETAPLRRQLTDAIAAAASLPAASRQRVIAEAAQPIGQAEEKILVAARTRLDAAAQRLALAREKLRDLVAKRAETAQQAARPGAPERLTGIVATHFESDGTAAAATGSSLDAFLASAQLIVPAVVLRGEPQKLTLAERIRPLLATRLTLAFESRLQGPRPPPPPRIAYITVLERGIDPATGLVTRVLGILGISLIDAGPPAVAGDADRVYEVIATRPGVLGVAPDESNAARWRILGDRVAAGLPTSDGTMARLLDAVLVRVRLPAGLLPGLEPISVAGAARIWPLDAPTTSATLAFVRTIPWGLADSVDRPQELFLTGDFAVQVDTAHPVRTESLDIALIGPEGRVPVEDAAGTRLENIPATHLAGFPLIMRTAPVHLYPAGFAVSPAKRTPGHLYAWARHNDTMLATIVGRPFDDGDAATTVDAATVLASPGSIPTVDGKGMLFFEAVVDAARIHEKELPGPDLASQPVVDTLTYTFLTQFRQHEIKFTLAHHAAMLMLKRTFLGMAGRVLASHREVLSSEVRIGAYVPEMTRIMLRGARLASDTGSTRTFPLGYAKKIRILAEKGLTPFGKEEFRGNALTPLFHAFLDFGELQPFAIYEDRREAAIFRHAATKLALETQVENLEKSIAYARGCDDTKVEELLELVGSGFGAIIEEVLPRLVRAEPDPAANGQNRWVPDRTARLAVTQLADTLQEHLTAQKAAHADTQAVLALLSATGLGIGLTGNIAGKVLLAVASAASVGAAALDVVNLELSRAESKFAAAAVEVIGEDRLVSNNRELDLSAAPYLTLGLSLLGLKLDFADTAKAIQLSVARRAAEGALPQIADNGFVALARLPIKQRTLASALIDEATALRAAGKPLTPTQQIALRAGRRIERQYAAWHPWMDWHYETKIALQHAPEDFRSAVTQAETDFRSAITEVEPPTTVPVAPAPKPAVPGPSLPPPAPAAVRFMDVEKIPHGMPLPGHELFDPVSKTTYRVGQPYGAGAYATTYQLLDSAGQPTGKVVKFLRQPFNDEAKIMARLRDAQRAGRGTTPVPFDPTPLSDVIDRIAAGQKLLKDADILHLKISLPDADAFAAAGRTASIPYVIQEVIPEGAVLAGKELEAGQQAAMAALYNKFAAKNLGWADGHLGNVYFQQGAGGWEAGVLDPDMIFHFDRPIESEFLRAKLGDVFSRPKIANIFSVEAKVQMLPEFSPDIARQVSTDAREFMARMMEHHQLVNYRKLTEAEAAAKGASRAFEGILDPEIVRREFGALEKYAEVR